MLKEKLQEKGYTDEQISNIIAEINASEDYVPKGTFNAKLNEIKGLKEQISQRDNQLKDFEGKVGENEALKLDLQKAKDANELLKKNHNEELKKFQKDIALSQKYGDSVYNIDDIKRSYDYNKLTLNERGEIIDGYEEQDKMIREKYPHYFKPISQKNPNIDGAQPSDGGTEVKPQLTDQQKAAQAGIDIVKAIRGIE